MKGNIINNKLFQYQSLFWTPDYIDASSAWNEHIPFAFWIVEVLKPKIIVELGVHTASSYFSFCQAVKTLNIDTACYGVDTWKGDEHAGFYGENIFEKVTTHNTKEFYRFSILIRSTFDEAKEYFIDKSIDLLHIDGFHSYEAVKHDFEAWLPKLSNNSFVFFHDINVRERDFGVFKFWEELKSQYDHFQFDFGHGLGVICIGKIISEELKELFESGPFSVFLRNIFSERGNFFKTNSSKDLILEQEKNARKELTAVNTQLSESNNRLQLDNTHLTESNNAVQSEIAQLIEQLTESNNKLQLQIAPLIENNKTLESSNRQLRESFKTLELINSDLQESFNDLTKDYERLRGHYTNLEARNRRLQEKYLNDVQSKLEELPGIKKENELLKKYIGWYRDTYETRSILGVIKTKLESKLKKKNDSSSGENPSSETSTENNSITAIGKSHYSGALKVRYKADTSHVSKACIFSSFSFSGEVEEYVYYYLDELKKAGFSTVFVSTSTLPQASVKCLSQYVCLIIERENICPDFGSWKAGLSLLDWEKLDAVLLTNDSVFGPLFNLGDIILSMKDEYDVWGMSDNYEGLHFSWNPSETNHHLQSYFLYFNAKAIASDTFRMFWDRVELSASKEEVIEKYEIGISRVFKDSGFRLGAYANADVVSKNAPQVHKVMNQLFVSWKPLIKDHRFPFFKRELLIRRDISKTHEVLDLYVNTSGWRKTIKEHSLYPIRLVEDFITNYYRLNKTTNNDLVLRKRKLLFLIDPSEDAENQEMLLAFLDWLKAKTETEVELVNCKDINSELTARFARFGRVTNLYALSEPEKKSLKGRLIDGISLIFSNTIRHIDAQKFLSFLDVPQVMFVHGTTSLFDRVPSEDDLKWIRDNISNFITDSDVATKFITEHVGIDGAKMKLVDKSDDFAAVQAPALLKMINTYHDDKELRLVEDPLLVFMAHIYYDNSWIEIRNKLRNFNNGRNCFLFSISEGCLMSREIIESIKESFDNAYFLVTPNLGKDIGGKLALIDLYLFLGIKSSYIVMLHDKQSLHSVYGELWKSELFKIIDVNNLPIILDVFRDTAVGVVGTKKWIVNEYDAPTGNFRNNNQLSKELCKRFHISIQNYDFIGGTMFWIRSSIIEKFFRKNDPILIRGELESGNVMDSHGESLTHTWERMFSWIATNDGYRIEGI